MLLVVAHGASAKSFSTLWWKKWGSEIYWLGNRDIMSELNLPGTLVDSVTTLAMALSPNAFVFSAGVDTQSDGYLLIPLTERTKIVHLSPFVGVTQESKVPWIKKLP
jgi:hypothetical protein